MTIYSLDFLYSGPRVNHPDDSNVAELAIFGEAEGAAERVLKKSGLHFRHQYSFPDGSIYRWAESNLPREEFQEKLKELILEENCDHLIGVRVQESNPERDPYKYGYKTLKEYMRKR